MFLQSIRKRRRTRFIAVFMAVNILAEIVSPSVALALTTGPSQPEVQSFEPVNTSEMVDLFSGDFKYNIPLMDVGGYPLNINYNSGVGMDQEASWVGLGWNLNVGAITRNMRGLPDDFNGDDQIKKEFHMKDNETFGGHLKLGAEIFGWGKLPKGQQGSSSTGISGGIAINYNNYTGVGVTQTFGINVGLSGGKSSDGKMNIGLGFSSSAAEGMDMNSSVSFSENMGNKDSQDEASTTACIGVGAGMNSRAGMKYVSLKASESTGKKDRTALGFNSSGLVNFGVSTYVPSIQFPLTTNAIATNFKLGGTAFGVEASLDVGGYYSNQHLSTTELTLPAYGYMHSHEGQDNDNVLMDFNREKDGAYNRNMQKLPITNYTYDVYNVAGQGIGGTYRPYRHDIGYVFDNESRNTNDSYSLGVEVDVGNTVHGGVDVSVVDVNTVIGKWKDQNNAINALRYQYASGALGEEYSFKEVGEKSVDSDLMPFISTGSFSPARVTLTGSGMAVSAKSELEYFHPSGGPLSSSAISSITTKRNNRHRRTQLISTLTYAQAKKFGLQETIYNAGIGNAKDHHIAEVTITKTDGSRYVYGLPAYNAEQVESTFNISGNTQSSSDHDIANGLVAYGGSDDSPGNNKGNDHYFNRVTTPAYAHSYMLTAVVSSDYVDSDNIPGPSDGDLGNYTKFEYETVADYDWRTPIGENKVNFNENTKAASVEDDYGSYVSGKRDMYYVHKIITKNYIAEFETEWRKDALGAANTGAPSTDDKCKLLKNIKLYARPEYDKQQALGISVYRAIPIKVVNFVYNYELCKGVPNNTVAPPLSGSSLLSGPEYVSGATNEGGKLTLKKIYFTYGTSDKAKLNSYNFEYDASRNPDYNPKAYDRWGNYKPNALPPTASASDVTALSAYLPNWEYPYTQQESQIDADNYSASWCLSKITLPSGADINVQYESDDYAFVQNLPAMNMCKAIKLVDDAPTDDAGLSDIEYPHMDVLMDGAGNIGSNNNFVIFKLPRPIPIGSVADPQDYFSENFLKDMYSGRYMYFRFLVNMTKRGSPGVNNYGDYFEYVSGYAELDNTQFGLLPPPSGSSSTNYKFGFVKIKPVAISKTNTATTVNPIAKAAWQLGRTTYPNLVWDASFNPSGGPADFIKALVQSDFTQNIIDAIKGPNLAIATKGYGLQTVMGKSWIRLYNPDGKKYGGGCRVKQLTINDNWDEMTNTGTTGENQKDFTYGQTYEYTIEERGRTISSGVAAYEPMIGGDEIPQRMPNYYTNQGNNPEAVNFLIPSDRFFTEEPYGESFFPAASVGYSKIKVANLKRTDAATPPNKIVKAHATGYVIHKFYTAKDYPTITSRTNIDKKPFKPAFASLLKVFARDFMTVTQGHAIEVNDMHGKPRGMEVYAEDKPGQPISTIEYKYKTAGPNGYEDPTSGDSFKDSKFKANRLNNECYVIDNQGEIHTAQIGVDYDMVADFRESETTTVMGGAQINLSAFFVAAFPGLIPSIWPDFSRDVTRFRSAVTTKVIYRSGILEKTIATDLGSVVETSNIAYDRETGEVLLTKTQNNFDDPVYAFNYPAHWAYENMGPAYKNTGAKAVNVTFSGGIAAIPDAENIFVEGDELAITHPPAYSAKGWVCSVSPSQIGVIDASGNAIPNSSNNFVYVLRSGRRNQQTTPVGTVISLVNPIDVDDNGPDVSLSFGTSATGKVIKTSAVEYADKWRMYPGHTETTDPSCSCNITQQWIDMYGVMNSMIASNLLMTTTPELLYDNAGSGTYYHNFTGNLLLPNGEGCIWSAINLNDHYWKYQSGSSANIAEFEIGPLGGYWNGVGSPPEDYDTHVINCSQRCFFNAILPSGLDWADVNLTALTGYAVVTSTSACNASVQVCGTYNREGLPIPVCFTVTPGGKCYDFVNCSSTPGSAVVCAPNAGDVVNPYFTGIKGNWRPVKSWSYLSDRSQTLTGSDPTKNTNIRKDGTLITKDHSTGSAIAFQPFWTYNSTAKRFEENPDYWTSTSEVTKYSPYGPELENMDALKRYSSAVYGYNESIPLIVGSNAKLQEIAYDGFEDYDFINPDNCGKKHFNFYEYKNSRTSGQSHTGLYSMQVNPSTSVKTKRKLPLSETTTSINYCNYALSYSDFLPLFSPTAQKYVLSYWVKETSSATPSSPVLTYNKSDVSISRTAGPITLSTPVKTGIIDGWQRVECTFDLPLGSTGDITVSLNNTSANYTRTSYFDDIRIHPFNSSVKSFVYNPVTLKYVAELDANNFATFYEYNEEGSLIRVKKETERGIMTIQETKNHTKR